MNTKHIFVTLGIALCLILGDVYFARPVSADHLACLEGVKETTFAHTSIHVPRPDQERFEQRFEDWGQKNGYHISSGKSDDPDAKPRKTTWDSFLQSKRYGVVLTAEGTNRNDTVTISVGNNCWAKRENWRTHWHKLLNTLSAWGYKVN